MGAPESLGRQWDTNYRGGHQPPTTGAPLHDLLATDHYPHNAYDELHHYTHMSGQEPADQESIRAVRSFRGRPDAKVTIYRAAPEGVTHINPGDWVTPSPAYAKQHAKHDDDPSQDWPIHRASVPAHTIRNGGNDIIEWGYHGDKPVPVKTTKPPNRGWPD